MPDLLKTSIKQLLHGAASVLGGSAAALIVFDEAHDSLTLSLGVLKKKYGELKQAETMLGLDTSDLTVPISLLPGSIIVRCWKNAKVFQTHTISDLVRGLVEDGDAAKVDELVGEHTYVCVPAIGSKYVEGVVIFEKVGKWAFAPVQTKLLLQYASRIARLVEAERLGRQASNILDMEHYMDPVISTGFMLLDRDMMILEANALPAMIMPEKGTSLEKWLDRVQPGKQDKITLPDLEKSTSEPVKIDFIEGQNKTKKLYAALFKLESKDSYLLQLMDTTAVDAKISAVGERLPMLLSGTASAVICVSSDLEILSNNELAEQLFKTGPGLLVGKNLADLIEPGTGLDAMGKGKLGAFGYLDQVANMKKNDGTVFPGHIMGLLLADETGSPDGALLAIEDLGDVPARSEENEKLEKKAMQAQRLTAMGEMAAQLAHELRNPLVALGALLQSLVEDPPEAPELLQELEAARNEVIRLDTLLQDYLALSGRIPLQPLAMDLKKVIQSTIELANATAAADGIKIETSIEPEMKALGDPQGIRQVLLNVLLNSIQFSPRGSIINISTTTTENTCRLKVRDAGPGLDPKVREQVFEPFFTTRKDGTGLGLTVCKRIMDELGGKIWFEEASGRNIGLTVVLELPKA
ncbi:MAG: hypothetical protein GXP49_02090 [Deltaproteobacteria bacterium]|nr:hypothetical protein [Deltaproteobacteria bacterium]